MQLITMITNLLLPPATGEGGDGGDANEGARFAKTPHPDLPPNSGGRRHDWRPSRVHPHKFQTE